MRTINFYIISIKECQNIYMINNTILQNTELREILLFIRSKGLLMNKLLFYSIWSYELKWI